MMHNGETMVIQTHANYMLAAQLYDEEGAEKIASFQPLTGEPFCYLFSSQHQLNVIAENLDMIYMRFLKTFDGPLYLKLKSSRTHEQMTGEKTIIVHYIKSPTWIQIIGRFGLLKAVALPEIKAPTLDEVLQTLYHTYQHITQTIYAHDDIKPTYEVISMIDLTGTTPKIIRQGDASIADFPDIQ